MKSILNLYTVPEGCQILENQQYKKNTDSVIHTILTSIRHFYMLHFMSYCQLCREHHVESAASRNTFVTSRHHWTVSSSSQNFVLCPPETHVSPDESWRPHFRRAPCWRSWESSRWQSKYLGSCHTCGRFRRSFRPLTSAWFRSGSCSLLGSETANGKPPFSSNSAFQIS